MNIKLDENVTVSLCGETQTISVKPNVGEFSNFRANMYDLRL